jgi:hypothetical protein
MRISRREPERLRRQRDFAVTDARLWRDAAAAAEVDARGLVEDELRSQRVAAASKHRALLKEMQSERTTSTELITKLEVQITELERAVLRQRAADRTNGRAAAAQQQQLEVELERAREGRT